MEDQRVALGDKLRRLRERKSLTQQQLADLSGLSQPEIHKLESGKRKFAIDKVLQLTKALSIEARELLPDGVTFSPSTQPGRGTAALRTTLEARAVVTEARTLPIKGIAQGEEGRVYMLPEETRPVDWTWMPALLERVDGAYGLFVFEDSMHPMFKRGQTMWIHPHQPPAPGDGVVLVKKSDDEIIVKELVRRTRITLTLRQYNPPLEFDLAEADLRIIHRVIGVLQAR